MDNSSGFSNPLIGGGGNLVYPAIQSPNFVHGTAGWTINKDGTAEFNSLTVRGGLSVGGTSIYYSTPTAQLNKMVASIGASSITDSAGNVTVAGLTTYAGPF